MSNVNPIQSDYDIKKIYEQIELDLIASMKRTLGTHKEDEELKGFKWRAVASSKTKADKRF